MDIEFHCYLTSSENIYTINIEITQKQKGIEMAVRRELDF